MALELPTTNAPAFRSRPLTRRAYDTGHLTDAKFARFSISITHAAALER